MSNMLRAPRAAPKTLRSNLSSSLDIGFGSSSRLPPGKLPSVKDVLQLISSYREQPKAVVVVDVVGPVVVGGVLMKNKQE